VDRRIEELQALRDELTALERHVTHCCEGCAPTENAGECGFCGLILLEEGGERYGANRDGGDGAAAPGR